MHSKFLRLFFILLFCCQPVGVWAELPECTCRAKNLVASEGQIVCLTTATGKRLAICEKVLNNTSWRFLPGECNHQVSSLDAGTTLTINHTDSLK